MFRKTVISLLLLLSVISVCNSQPPALAEKDKTAYLFVYFTGNRPADEAIRFAVSSDGYNYFALNDTIR